MSDNPTARPPEVVRHDVGGWISGPCLRPCGRCGQPAPEGSDWCAGCEEQDGAEALAALSGTEPVAAGDVLIGDVLLTGGTVAEVTDVRSGDYWLTTGKHGPGVALGWRSGTSSGVMFRSADDTLERLAR